MGEDGKCHKWCYISARGYMLLENIWLRGVYSGFPGQQRPKCISFTLDSPIQNRGLCVLHGSGKMGHVLNGVISHLGGICF